MHIFHCKSYIRLIKNNVDTLEKYFFNHPICNYRIFRMINIIR